MPQQSPRTLLHNIRGQTKSAISGSEQNVRLTVLPGLEISEQAIVDAVRVLRPKRRAFMYGIGDDR